MNSTSGTVTIASGTTSKTIIIDPTADTTLEPDETIQLKIIAGTGYDFGSPSTATSVLKNDDTLTVIPEVAITGTRHYSDNENGISEFSFVALKDLPASASYVFSSDPFDKNLLTFSSFPSYPSALKWTAPSGGVLRGDEIVVKKTAANTFVVTKNGSTTFAGSVVKLSPSKNFYISQYEGYFRALTDADSNPYNGITAVQSQIYTYDASTGNGGDMPVGIDLSTLYVGSVLVDGFPNTEPLQLEYKPALRPTENVDQANFENPSNWLYSQPLADLSPVPFHNIIISEGGLNPSVSITIDHNLLPENDFNGYTVTFTLSEVQATTTNINFSVGGTATYNIDYQAPDAGFFTSSQGGHGIDAGQLTSSFTIHAVNDNVLETAETIILTLLPGTGYDSGSPSVATMTILDDDFNTAPAKMAVLGMTHLEPTEFSVVAMEDIAADSVFYFTTGTFNRNTLAFDEDRGVMKYVAPSSTCIPKGTVLVITGDENGPLTVNCNSTSGNECGTATLPSGVFDFINIGMKYYIYTDTDDDPTNGLTQIHSLIHTGGITPSNHSGGNLQPDEDPRLIYTNAVVTDGFPAGVEPNRTEFNPTLRNTNVTTALLEDTANWLSAQPNGPLDRTNFNVVMLPSIIYVNENATAGGDGASWATAYNSLQDALQITSTCLAKEIWVAQGTYKPDVSDVTIPFNISANTTLLGGFSGTETLASQRNWNTYPTILSGDLNNNNTSDDGDSHTIIKIENDNSTLNGFIIENGFANGFATTIDKSGAGIYNEGQDIEVVNCLFRNNNAPGGGSNGEGGGIYNLGSIVVTNCLFHDNSGSSKGGGILHQSGTATITNCTFSANSSFRGGAINTLNGTTTVVNSIFSGNSATNANPDISNDSASGGTTVSYSLFNGVFTGNSTDAGNNVVSTDPLFVNAGNNNYTLQATSPAVEAGNNTTVTETLDLAANSRIVDRDESGTATVDMGCYEAFDACSLFTTNIAYVNANATGNNDGTDWTNAYTDLQDALAIVENCSALNTIYVAEGTYKPTITTDRTISFELFPDVAIYGGFSPTNGAIDLATRDFETYETILSGDIGTVDDISDNSYHVVFAENIGDNVILDGFTIAKGNANGSYPANRGAGIYLSADGTSTSSPVLNNLLFKENNAQYGGGLLIGGINTSVISPTLTNCSFTQNNAVTNASGIYIVLENSAIGNTNFNNVDFNNNTALGGTISSYSGDQSNYNAEYVNCSFSSNISNNRVGAISVQTSSNATTQNTLINCLFNNNQGRAMSVTHNSSNPNLLNIINCTFSENTTSSGNGGAIRNFGATIFNITNSILWNNSPDELSLGIAIENISYSLIEGFDNSTNNGLDGSNPANDPQFTDVANEDYTVLPTSPVIDLGDNAAVTLTEDLAGNDRIKDGDGDGDGTATVDMGVYEADTVILPPVSNFTGNGNSLEAFGCTPLTVDFVDTSTSGTGSTITAWDWDFGDGNTSTLQNPTYIYYTPGNYTVSLTITNSINEMDTETKTYFATALGPDVDFSTSDPTTGCQPLTVNFIDDTTPTTVPIVTWLWDFGDGNTSNLQNPSHTYTTIGIFDVSLTVNDLDGCPRTETKTAFISTEDNEAPIAVCQSITVQLDSNGNATITAEDVDGGSTDNCSIATLAIDIDTYDCSNVGDNNVVLTVTDANGNSSTCTAVVTVEDNVAPIANCAAPFTIQLDANGMASITVADIENGSTDACGIASTTIDKTDFTCADVGPNTVTLTVTDVNGNVSNCTTIVIVEDNVPPVTVCMDITVQLDVNGDASITAADVDGGSTDNCGIALLAVSPDTFTCADVGPNNVTLTVTDVNGNPRTCSTTVTVEDSIAPTIVCPADIMANTDPSDCFATVNFSTPVALDNCSVANIVQTAGLPSGSQFPVGVSTVAFTATDVNGNASTCNFTIMVTDNEPPVAVCQPITIQLDASGNASITAADVDGGSTDQCGVDTISVSPDTFDCSNVGDNNVILTVTDVNGNSSTCTAIVTVEDVTAPVVSCQNITVELDANGTVTIQGTDIDNGSTDACSIASYDLDIDTFDCSNIGDNNVILTVTDINGNSSTCNATVTVADNTAPVLVCQNFTIGIGVDGTATLHPSDVIAINDDACGILTVAVDITGFSCADIGAPVTVQIFSEDTNGNLATCTATVTAVDDLAPEITCPADQTVDPGADNLFYIVPDYFVTGEATAMDNCTNPVALTSQDPSDGTALPDGTHTITLTAEDQYGNIGTCSFELTVDTTLGAGDHNQSLGTVQLYPNPATNIVNIGNPNNLDLQRASIYDLRGRLVQAIDLRGMGTLKPIDVGQFSVATYMVVIESNMGQITKRLIKK